jgi:hypothetical protein
MVKDSAHKLKRIRKMAASIREDEAAGHENGCKCAVCEATYFLQRTAVWLEGALEQKAKDHGKPQEG